MKDVKATGEASRPQRRGEHPELLFLLWVIFAHLDPNCSKPRRPCFTLFSFLALWLVIPERVVRWSGNQIEDFLDALVLRVCLVQLLVALHLHKKKE
jgi:hypothetical protein